MSHLTEQFFAETGDKAMYRMKSSDYHTLRYVKWLEAKVENGSSYNNASGPCKAHTIGAYCICGGLNEKCGDVPCVIARPAVA